MTEFYNQFFCEDNPQYSVTIEDDGKVAYAYLFKDSGIIGDIWLYNQDPTPEITSWNKHDMPFLNPKEYIKYNIEPIISVNEINLSWSILENNDIDEVLIYINNKLIAKLTPGSTPGWSTCVLKNGPLAMVL
ncbi:hypothetical protein [Pedobacter metabolipauper]|uniref:Uncharacterized protein n=1 Tax=Pedobacter metabolipauper TaxID=425513 RepID=A0A4R6SWZ6_9SPHI|nr:hypothetical protein [Pedobacter metabolipauper]TDQ09202.1 hypothetical protein ATK78_1356 [Pedobacter metabolipauper]